MDAPERTALTGLLYKELEASIAGVITANDAVASAKIAAKAARKRCLRAGAASLEIVPKITYSEDELRRLLSTALLAGDTNGRSV